MDKVTGRENSWIKQYQTWMYQKPLDCIYTPNWEFVLKKSGESANVRMVSTKTNKKVKKELSEEEKRKKQEEEEQNTLFKILSENSFEEYKKKREAIEKKKQMMQRLKKPTKEDIEMSISNPNKKDAVLKRCGSSVSMRRSTSRQQHFVTSWVDPQHPKHPTSITKSVDYHIDPLQTNTTTTTINRPSTATGPRRASTPNSTKAINRPSTAASLRKDEIMENHLDISSEVARAKEQFQCQKLDFGLLEFRKQTDRQFNHYPWIDGISPSFNFVNNVNYNVVEKHIPNLNLDTKTKRFAPLESKIYDLSYDVQTKLVEKPISYPNIDIYLMSGRESSGNVSTKIIKHAASFQTKLVDQQMKKLSLQ